MKATKVRWFHPDGEKMPNGVFFQRGSWLAECAENARRFAAADGVGVVVFPTGAQVEGGGKAFSGSYVSEGGIRYDSGSPTRTLEGVSGRELLKHAAKLAEAWGQPEVPFFDGSEKNRERLERMYAHMAGVLGRAGLEDATVSRRMETAATSRSGFSRWANRGMLYGGRFGWEKGEVW